MWRLRRPAYKTDYSFIMALKGSFVKSRSFHPVSDVSLGFKVIWMALIFGMHVDCVLPIKLAFAQTRF